MKHRCPYCGKRFASRPRYERHVSDEEVTAAVRGLEADGFVEVRGETVRLTEQGKLRAAARRAAGGGAA